MNSATATREGTVRLTLDGQHHYLTASAAALLAEQLRQAAKSAEAVMCEKMRRRPIVGVIV